MSVRQAGRESAEQAKTISKTAERTAQAGADALRQNAGSVSSAWLESSETVTRIAERSMDQFSKLFGLGGDNARQTMQRSAQNVEALIGSSTVAAGALQNLSGEWMRFLQHRIEENLEHMDEFRACRSPQDCIELQTRVVRENIDALLQTARRTSELSAELAKVAADRMMGAGARMEH